MPDTMIERVARALWGERRDAMKWREPDGWLKGMPWDSVGRHDVTKDVAAQMRSAARAAIAALMEPTDGMVDAMIMQTALDPQRTPDAYSAVRHAYRAAITAALKETPDA
jgi:hypothetical protein